MDLRGCGRGDLVLREVEESEGNTLVPGSGSRVLHSIIVVVCGRGTDLGMNSQTWFCPH